MFFLSLAYCISTNKPRAKRFISNETCNKVLQQKEIRLKAKNHSFIDLQGQGNDKIQLLGIIIDPLYLYLFAVRDVKNKA